ncbi:MAG: YkgJ family cysteine cluster protein [Planctomycetaceae bacterium]|nr:YkgJ family cysteine cluster protein [Planctomycetaceae bacterium]
MVTATKKKFQREDLKAGEVLCEYCTAKCCRYFALPVDTPKNRKDFDNFRWYMLHGRVAFFVEDGTWFLMVYADCKHLQPDHMCGIYETRPQICRDYSTDNCEFDDDALYDMYFETPEQLWEFAQAILPPEQQRKFSAEPVQPGELSLPLA